MADLKTLMCEIADDLRFLPEHLARVVTKRSEAILYEIAPQVCQYGPHHCDGKLVWSLTRSGRNWPVCQRHYPDAAQDPAVRQREREER